jgi:hypothetical protein
LKDGWKKLNKQLYQVIIDEQDENGVATNRNLRAD